METLDEATRKQVALFLPKALEKVFESYEVFINTENEKPLSDEAEEDKRSREKRFSEHHGAAKIALAHIELLFKLGKIAGISEGLGNNPAFKKMMAHANVEYHSQKQNALQWVDGQDEDSHPD